jgi:hypothetical protein
LGYEPGFRTVSTGLTWALSIRRTRGSKIDIENELFCARRNYRFFAADLLSDDRAIIIKILGAVSSSGKEGKV